jgi:DNA repair exonuclease SbcCD ATPase subunit
MNNKNQLDSLQKILIRINISDFNLQQLAEKQIEKDNNKKVLKEQKEIIRRLRIQNKKLLEQLATLKKKLKQSSEERAKITGKMNYTKKLNNSLSEALGSCNNCWGEDSNCTNCSGNGVPGWRKINKRLFNMYVLPALENLYSLNKKTK